MDNQIIHNLDGDSSNGFSTPLVAVFILVSIVIGSLVGFGIAQLKGSGSTTVKSPTAQNTNNEPVAKQAGIKDKATFKDSAEGLLKEGGFEDEGSFHLERPGGESQNVYLTSTAVDLSQYVGKKIKVWGQTYKGQKAAWLMDVGLVETE